MTCLFAVGCKVSHTLSGPIATRPNHYVVVVYSRAENGSIQFDPDPCDPSGI